MVIQAVVDEGDGRSRRLCKHSSQCSISYTVNIKHFVITCCVFVFCFFLPKIALDMLMYFWLPSREYVSKLIELYKLHSFVDELKHLSFTFSSMLMAASLSSP